MKYFIIFREGKFLGYCVSKEVIKQFLKERGERRYDIRKVPKEKIEPLTKNINFMKSELDYYELYQRTLFEHEFLKIQDVLGERFVELHTLYLDIKSSLKYIKLTEEEKTKIKEFLYMFERISDDLLHEESCVTREEYFNTDDIVRMVIRNN